MPHVPVRARPSMPLPLARLCRANTLPCTHPWVRQKPLPTDPARALLPLRHPRVVPDLRLSRLNRGFYACASFREHRRVNSRERLRAARPLHPKRTCRASRHHLLARVSAALRPAPSPLLDDAPRSRLSRRYLRLRPLCRAHARHPGRHHSRANRRRAPRRSTTPAPLPSRTAALVLARLTSLATNHTVP